MAELKVGDHVRANYDGYYRDGSSEWRRLGALDKVANIMALCGELPRHSIIEIGAGEGSILQRMSEVGFGEELYATEIATSGLDVIKRKAIPRLIECSLFDGYHIPYDEDRFDMAILSHVIEHVEHPRQLLYEASRVARYVFIEVPLEDTTRLPRDYAPNAVGHINVYSPRTIRWLAQSCHLRVLSQLTTNPSKRTYLYQLGRKGAIHYFIKEVLLAVLPGIAPRHFCYHGSLLCERDAL